MSRISINGKETATNGDLPVVDTQAPEFTLTKSDFSDVSLSDFAGKTLVLNIFPSIDTPTCAKSVKAFNALVSQTHDTVVLCISMDLPFAHGRFCAAEGIENVVLLSEFRHPSFGDIYGVRIAEGSYTGLLLRAVIVIDPTGTIVFTQQVKELSDEPDYAAVLGAVHAITTSRVEVV